MSMIEFSKETRAVLVQKLSRYLKSELDMDVGGFDAAFLLDFVSETLGPYYYNQGLQDAQAIFAKKVELISEAVYELEKPVKG